jgi:integrase
MGAPCLLWPLPWSARPLLIEAWLACDKLSYPFGSMAKLLLLTGQRRNEVSGMTWAKLDLDKALWRIPGGRTKNDEAHEVPLSDATLSLIASELGSHYALSATTFAGRLRQSGANPS